MQGIAYWIEKRSYLHPDRIAIITEEEEMTYKQLHEYVSKVAAYLIYEVNVQKGERIAILSQNSLEYIVLLFAIAKVECIAVPLNIRLTENELIFQLKDSGTTVLFVEETFQNMALSMHKVSYVQRVISIKTLKEIEDRKSDNFEEINESASFIICYTSGTTGKPKGAVLTQKNMFWNALNNTFAIDLTMHDRSIVLLPLFHIGGIGLFAFPTLFAGGVIIIPRKFEPTTALSMIEKHKVTVVMGVPTIHQALINSPKFETTNLQSVRWFYNGGAPCPEELMREFIDRGFLFGQGFGMTETSPTVFMLSEEDARHKVGSIGKPVLFCDYVLIDEDKNKIEIGEVGELLIRGPNVMKEYWNRPDATKETIQDGWLYTGDLAKVDEDGFVYIVGRKKEMIISGGENIYPLEVEQVINKISEVYEVAVVGRQHVKWGEIPIAFIVKKSSSELTEKEVIEHCCLFLAKYKIPKEIVFLEELPKNATGKIQKVQLANQLKSR
ncbi:TPA: o-succinylbenzoate--CoA ligase [Bacillus cereus]|uniref:O-succinylbenzoate--CoA ligase n=1 Tax=Bacillus cereus TaxID=1396 RepID=A0A1D3N9D8_BACCE|nr:MULTISPECIES: o-succinylbenzoate--CoA ligase [Bacillus]MCP1178870.1 o-succinylbenzoate--CoA ligase [Bacillus sp. 1663tsa1]MCP1281397.1 o-succinylbenzoate--CoA ligase [Bacillus sp. S0635]MCQ6345674.1 o-succinylbenzoate--CoA ligase [Bacillus cereus]MCU5461784.1 o-succinylbenzoate--CoA ligase [Bacillus cereus]MCU5751795.1 o-succinylbenzoate--CoA ligase [Bacillus cereus]